MRNLVIGTGKAEFTAPIIEQWNVIIRSGRLASFLDFTDMRVYDSQFRTALTGWAVSQLRHLKPIHAFSRSKVVVMGSSLANLALGGILHVHGDEADFQRAVKESGLPPRNV